MGSTPAKGSSKNRNLGPSFPAAKALANSVRRRSPPES